MKSSNFLTWHVCRMNLMFCTFSRTILGSPCVMWAIMTGGRGQGECEMWSERRHKRWRQCPGRGQAGYATLRASDVRPVTLDPARGQQQRPSNNTGRCAQLCCWRWVTFGHSAVATAPPARHSATTPESGPQQQAPAVDAANNTRVKRNSSAIAQ